MLRNEQFDKLYHKSAPILFKFIAKHLHKDQIAVEEVFEETIVAGWKGYKSFEHKSSYFTWLCRIALNKIADYYHDQINENSHIVVPLIDSLTYIDRENFVDKNNLSPEETLALKELRTSVSDCLNLLPYEKRRLLWFRYWKDYSYDQIGKLLGISGRAVEGRIYRAKEEFAEVWSTKNK